MKKFYKTIIFLFVLCYRIFLVVSGSANKPLRIDEGYSNITSLVIFQKWLPLYDSGHWDGSYMYFHYLQAFVFKFWGYSDQISRIVPILLGLLSLYFVYKISKLVYENKIIAYTSVAITAFSYYFEVAVTQARYYSMLMLLYLVGIYFILLFYKNKTIKYFFIALNVVFAAVIFHVYLYSLLVLLFAVLLIILYQKKDILLIKIKSFDKDYFKISLITILNFVFFYAVVLFLTPGQSAGAIQNTLQFVQFDYINKYVGFLNYSYGVLFVLVYIGLLNLYIAKNKVYNFVLLLAFFFPFFVISKYVFMMATRYVFFLIPLIVMISIGTLGIYFNLLKNKILKIVFSCIILLLVFYTVKINFDFRGTLYINDITSPEPDFKSAYDFIKSDKDFASGANIISCFPHMDYIYLSQSDGYLYIDETGMGVIPQNNFYVKNGKNIFTQAKLITGVQGLSDFGTGKTDFIIMDQLCTNRLKGTPIYDYITKNYQKVFENIRNYNTIQVYKKK